MVRERKNRTNTSIIPRCVWKYPSRVFWCRKLSLCALVPVKSWRQSLGWNRKEELYCFSRQRETQQAPALENCPNLGGFGEEFYGNSSRVGLLIRIRACTPFICSQLISWWASLVPFIWLQMVFSRMKNCWRLAFVGGFSSVKSLQILLCVSGGRNRTLPQGCAVVSWLCFLCLWISSLPWLATVWICSLGHREGLGGWGLFPTNKEWEHRNASTPGRPTGSCLVSLPEEQHQRLHTL